MIAKKRKLELEEKDRRHSKKVRDRQERQKEKVEDMQRKTYRAERQKVEYRESRTQGKTTEKSRLVGSEKTKMKKCTLHLEMRINSKEENNGSEVCMIYLCWRDIVKTHK